MFSLQPRGQYFTRSPGHGVIGFNPYAKLTSRSNHQNWSPKNDMVSLSTDKLDFTLPEKSRQPLQQLDARLRNLLAGGRRETAYQRASLMKAAERCEGALHVVREAYSGVDFARVTARMQP